MPLPGGGTGPRIADLHLPEAVLHGWDLATATDRDRTGDLEAVRAAFDAHPTTAVSRPPGTGRGATSAEDDEEEDRPGGAPTRLGRSLPV
ncbi:hypothetical protein ACFXEL_25860 [Streptomyces sp. NPDC059382]|uniref:hypothetical protein n=1 Tax=Streptomyces sp. NPDC059382 TaxID=3346816 RepID=UPI00369036C6